MKQPCLLLLVLALGGTFSLVLVEAQGRQDIFVYEERRNDIPSNLKENYMAYSDPYEYKLRAQDDWGKVSISDIKEHIYDWEGRTQYIRYDGNECNIRKYPKQSPILLRDDGAKCGDEHRMRGKSIARCQFENMNFTTTSHGLSMKVDGCLSHDGKIPKIDFSHLPSNFHLVEMSIKTPSEHCWQRTSDETECFDGELVFSHYGELTNKGDHRRDILNLAALIKVVPDDEMDEYNEQASKKQRVPNRHYNKMLQQWAKNQQRQYRRCANRDDIDTFFAQTDIEWGEPLCQLKQKVHEAYELRNDATRRRRRRLGEATYQETSSHNNSTTSKEQTNHHINEFLKYLEMTSDDSVDDDDLNNQNDDFLNYLRSSEFNEDDEDEDWNHEDWFEPMIDLDDDDDDDLSFPSTTNSTSFSSSDEDEDRQRHERQRRRHLARDIKIYSKFLPQHHYYRYEGSMTTPPCMNRVHWRIMRIPLRISEMQLRITNYLISAHLNSECELATVGRPKSDGSCEVEVNRRLQPLDKSHDLQDCWKWNGKKWDSKDFIFDPKYVNEREDRTTSSSSMMTEENEISEGNVIPVPSMFVVNAPTP